MCDLIRACYLLLLPAVRVSEPITGDVVTLAKGQLVIPSPISRVVVNRYRFWNNDPE